MSKLSFAFKKKTENSVIKPVQSQFATTKDEEDKKEFITSICNNKIESKIKPEEKKELVIELRESKRSKLLYKKVKKENLAEENQTDLTIEIKQEAEHLSLDELAKRELLEESLNERKIKKENNLTIKLNEEQIKPFEEEAVEDADYSKVHVDDFGMALLRGMAKNREDLKATKIYEPRSSAGGVGLGFQSHLKREQFKNQKNAKKNKRYLPGEDAEDEEANYERNKDPDEIADKEIKIGSFVCIEHGKVKGHYGEIVSIDDDLTRCELRLGLNKQILTLPIGLIRLVSKKEYSKESKVLNRSKYDQFKIKER